MVLTHNLNEKTRLYLRTQIDRKVQTHFCFKVKLRTIDVGYIWVGWFSAESF